MNNKTLYTAFFSAALFLPITVSAKVDGRICFQSTSSLLGAPTVFSDFRITYQKESEVATIAGQICVKHPTLQKDECLASIGSLQVNDGLLEIIATSSNKLTIEGTGDIFSFVDSYTQLDPATLTGTGGSFTTTVLNGVITSSFSSDGTAVAVPCPKLTATDKENIKLRNKLLRQLDAL